MAKNKTFVLSDGTVNSYGFAIDMDKLHLDRFNSNPVMLYNHYDLIGKWDNIKLENGKLTADPVFMDDEDEATALKVKKRVDNEFVKGASLGFNIISVTHIEGEAPLVEAEVIECSIVDIPSNKNAITLYDKDGNKLEGEAFQLALKVLDPEPQNKPKNDREMKLSAKNLEALGLKDDASDEQINSAVAAVLEREAKLKADAESANKKRVETLISTALKAGQITAANKEKFEKLAESDFELAQETIDALPKKETLAGNEQLSGKPNSNDDRSEWTFADWRQKDTKGLLAIKAEDPDRYAEILTK